MLPVQTEISSELVDNFKQEDTEIPINHERETGILEDTHFLTLNICKNHYKTLHGRGH